MHNLPLRADVRAKDLLEIGEVHYRIRRYRSIPEVLKLLKSLGYHCLQPQDINQIEV